MNTLFAAPLLVSTAVVALGEIGDKTPLLALLLAARFRQPVPIVLGILIATLLNHALAGLLGNWIGAQLDPQWLRWIVSASFFAMAVWLFIPDELDADTTSQPPRFGVFAATFVAYFLAEMGDKTQLATVALAAHYPALLTVVAGTTLGKLIADVPVVLLGDRFATRLVDHPATR